MKKDIEVEVIEGKEYSMRQLMDYLKSAAEQYDQTIEHINHKNKEIDNLKNKYQSNIEKICQIYAENYNKIMQKKTNLETQKYICDNKLFDLYENLPEDKNFTKEKEELARLATDGKIDELEKKAKLLKQKIEEVKQRKIQVQEDEIKLEKEKKIITEAIVKCEKELDNCTDKMNEDIKLQTALRDERFHKINDKYLVVFKKKNSFAKTFGWFKNVISGKKRYIKEILNPLERGINDLEENKIPKIQNRVENETKEFISYIDKKAPIYYQTAKRLAVIGIKKTKEMIKYTRE